MSAKLTTTSAPVALAMRLYDKVCRELNTCHCNLNLPQVILRHSSHSNGLRFDKVFETRIIDA